MNPDGERRNFLGGSLPLTGASFASMFFIGVALAIVGAAAKDVGLSPSQIGWLISTKYLGFLVAVLVSGWMADRYSKTRLLFVGSLLLSAAFSLFYLSPIFWVNLIVIVFVGLGAGTYEGVSDALLLDVHRRNPSRYIAVNHFFITFGMAAIALYLIFLQLDWRRSMVQAGVSVAVLAVFYLLARQRPRPARSPDLRRGYPSITHRRGLLLLFLATVPAAGVELGTVGVLTSFLVDLRGSSIQMAKIGLVIFLAGILAGRLLSGVLIRESMIVRYLQVALAACVVAFGVLYFVDLGRLTLVAVFLCGLAISAVSPLIFCLAGLRWCDDPGTVMALVKASVPGGGILLPLLIGVISSLASFSISLIVFPLASLASLVLLCVAVARLPEQKTA
ncbi:MAG: MFS transporter [Candidatus Alcyoniella australis]|nr:MFS transporter [Candidatus Alcyoniella australis]